MLMSYSWHAAMHAAMHALLQFKATPASVQQPLLVAACDKPRYCACPPAMLTNSKPRLHGHGIQSCSPNMPQQG